MSLSYSNCREPFNETRIRLVTLPASSVRLRQMEHFESHWPFDGRRVSLGKKNASFICILTSEKHTSRKEMSAESSSVSGSVALLILLDNMTCLQVARRNGHSKST